MATPSIQALLQDRAVQAIIDRRVRVASVHDAKALDAWREVKVRWQPPHDAASHDTWMPASSIYYTNVPMDTLYELPRTNRQRIFDLTIYNHEDLALWMRSKELVNASVDQTIMIQTAFTFNGAQKKAFKSDAPELDPQFAKRVQRVVLERPPPMCFADIYAKPVVSLKGTSNATMVPWCVQSAVRNSLGLAFVRAGGRPNDWAIISDADEVPTAAAVESLRDLPVRKKFVYRMGLTRNFRYTLRCTAPNAPVGQWTAGAPVAVPGHVLLDMGAQRARDYGARSCVRMGYRGTCGRLKRSLIENASWHFSSFGSPESQMHKMQSNSYQYPTELFDAKLLRDRQRRCLPAVANSVIKELTKGQGRGYRMTRTEWGPASLPRYPDVPKCLEDELARGGLPHLLDADAEPPLEDSAGRDSTRAARRAERAARKLVAAAPQRKERAKPSPRERSVMRGLKS